MDNVVSLDDLFHKRTFRVPDYQRGFSWDNLQIREFLEDLELLRPTRYHYTGTIVVHESDPGDQRMDEDGNAYVPVEIVDGQQRLTTIVLLLDGIRRSLAGFSETAKGLSQGIRKNFIFAQEINGQRLFKLSLNSDTDHFFKTNILADPSGVEGPQITSERRLAAAKKQIADYLASSTGTDGIIGEEWLLALYTKVATQLRFTLYQVGDEAEVGVIFEVMNDRGKPLTDLEKVKNYLLHTSTSLEVSNDLAKTVNDAWGEILRQLMAAGLVLSADEDRLLRTHWLTHHDPQSRRWQGSRSVKSRFDLRNYKGQHTDLLDNLTRYTEGLRASCVSFCDAYQPNRSDAFASFNAQPKVRAQVVEWSAKLVRVGVVATFLPLLLAVRKRWPDDSDKYLEVLKLCEACAFRVYRLGGYRSDAGQSALFHLGYDLAEKKLTFNDAVQAIKSHIAFWCDDESFQEHTTAGGPDDWYSWPGLRYLLYEYEVALASAQGASPLVTWDELRRHDLQDTIEHILPQSIDQQPYWKRRFRPRNHEKYVHDLGNLTLTKHNSNYGNKSFPDKKGEVNAKVEHCYAKSPLYVERQLTQWEDWNAAAIDERRAQLLEWARSRWAVDLGNVEGVDRELDVADGPDDDIYSLDEGDDAS